MRWVYGIGWVGGGGGVGPARGATGGNGGQSYIGEPAKSAARGLPVSGGNDPDRAHVTLPGPDSLRQRPGDQPLPHPQEGPVIHDLVVVDLAERLRLGVSRYGTPLRAGNGRDALRDLYEELLDAAVYARQLLEERDRMTSMTERSEQ